MYRPKIFFECEKYIFKQKSKYLYRTRKRTKSQHTTPINKKVRAEFRRFPKNDSFCVYMSAQLRLERANEDRPIRICSFLGIRRESALTFLFIGVVSWDSTRLRMRCKSLDFCFKKYFPRSKNIFGQNTSDLRYKEKCHNP